MQDYLQKLVIILPATAVVMGGLLLVVWIYSRPNKDPKSSLPVPLRSVTTQVDESLQINEEIRNKLIEEAMESVKSILSENVRKREVTKISLEEFNKLYRKLDSSGGDVDDAKHVESAIVRIPGVASLAYESAPQAVPKTESFATLWVEELQKTGDGDDSRPELEPPPPLELDIPTPPPQVMEFEPEITQESEIIEATDDHLNEVTSSSPNELKLIQDLELHLLTSSSNLYRSMKALQATLNEHHADVPRSMLSAYEYLERSAELVLASVASTSTSCRTVAPPVLKGGDGAVPEWRLDIEEIPPDVVVVEESPPHTPLRRRPPSHLSPFTYEDHDPPPLSTTDLDPAPSYRWHDFYGQTTGPSRQKQLQLDHRSERVEARRKWDAIKDRYRGERGRTLLRPDLPIQSVEWRKRLRTLYSPDSSSESGSDQLHIRIRRAQGGEDQGADRRSSDYDADPNRPIKSLLTSSSSSSGPESDEASDLERVRQLLGNYSPSRDSCKMEHQEPDQGSSGLSSPSCSEIE